MTRLERIVAGTLLGVTWLLVAALAVSLLREALR